MFGAGDRPDFWVASRGHHADVGGLTPGSMPPASRSIDEEGILIDDFLLVRSGQFQEKALIERLTEGRFPVRNLLQNLGDIHAQLAANQKGITVVLEIVERYGSEVVSAYMNYIRQNAAEQVRRAIDHLTSGTFLLPMDCGAQIQVAITVDSETRSARIHFTGTSAQVADNFNAPSAVVRAAVTVCLPNLDPRGDSAERWMFGANRDKDPGWFDARPKTARCGSGWQCRDFSIGGERIIWRARGASCRPGNHEQSDLWE